MDGPIEQAIFFFAGYTILFDVKHGLRTTNEGINQRYLKNWADVADKICFGRTLNFGIGIEFSAVQWRLWALWASIVRGPNRPTAVQGYQGTITKVPRLFQGPLWISVVMVFVVSNVMTYLLHLTIFARKEAQLWTTSAEYSVQVTNFQIFSFVYHFIRLWTEILNYSTAVKFIYSAKATKFCKISTNHLTGSTYDE